MWTTVVEAETVPWPADAQVEDHVEAEARGHVWSGQNQSEEAATWQDWSRREEIGHRPSVETATGHVSSDSGRGLRPAEVHSEDTRFGKEKARRRIAQAARATLFAKSVL